MLFDSCISGTYRTSVRVAAGSTDPGIVTCVCKLLVCLPDCSLLNEGKKKGYIAHVPFLIRKSLDFKLSLEIMRGTI